MKQNLLVIVGCFFSVIMAAQNISFDSLQYWKGDITHFFWNSNVVKLDQNISGISLIYCPTSWDEDIEFNLTINLNFSPSANNQFELLLSNDSLFKDSNLVALKVGEAGPNDGLDILVRSVLKFRNSNRGWGKGGTESVSIKYLQDSLMFFEGHNKRKLGAVHFMDFPKFIGLRCKYTKSNADKYKFDNLFFGVIAADTVAPVIIETKNISATSVEVCFSEAINNIQLSCVPVPVKLEFKDSSIILCYNNFNEDFTIKITDSIKDMEGNIVALDTSIFINYFNKYDLIISEIMANPDLNLTMISDEYVELYNRSDSLLPVSGVELWIDGAVEVLLDTILKPNTYWVIFPKKALLNSGSEIKIVFNSRVIHQVKPNLDWYKDAYKNKGGFSLEMIDFTKPCLNELNWTASESFEGGSPGFINTVQGSLNEEPEFLFEQVFPLNDTMLEVVFNFNLETTPTINSILLNDLSVHEVRRKENTLLLITDQMKQGSVYNFKMIEPLYSCWDNGIVDSVFSSYGLPCSPEVYDIVFNEILVNPDFSGSDFIEIVNTSDHFFNLRKLQLASFDKNRNIADVHLLSTGNRLIAPSEIIAFTEDLDWIVNEYDDYGKVLHTDLPACNNDEDDILLMDLQGNIIDELSYSENWHYSALNSNENVSLEKIDPSKGNNDRNWFSASSSSGYGTPGLVNSNLGYKFDTECLISIDNDIITPNNDGQSDFLGINFNLNKIGWTGSVEVINPEGIGIYTLARNYLFGQSDKMYWNCELPGKSSVKAGIYVLFFQMIHLETGDDFNKKIIFYVNKKIL